MIAPACARQIKTSPRTVERRSKKPRERTDDAHERGMPDLSRQCGRTGVWGASRHHRPMSSAGGDHGEAQDDVLGDDP